MTQKSNANQDHAQRGSVDSHTEPRFLVIGEIAKPHGVRGEMRVALHTELPERFTWLDTVYLGQHNPRQVAVEGVRFHKNWVLLKLEGYNDRTAVEVLRGQQCGDDCPGRLGLMRG